MGRKGSHSEIVSGMGLCAKPRLRFDNPNLEHKLQAGDQLRREHQWWNFGISIQRTVITIDFIFETVLI